MKKIFSILMIAGIVALTNCSGQNKSIVKPDMLASAIEKRSLMIGKWLGEMKNEKGDLQQWLTTRFPDGTYKIQFRVPDRGSIYKEQIEAGLWGISGPIYFTIMKGWIKDNNFIPSNPNDPSYYDAYKIIEINKKILKYKSFESDITFEVKKVDDDFEL